MPFYIGEKKIVDRYIGDKLVIAAYKGESKYFDAYSEITGTLPIIFKSRVAVALKNYRIYGTSEGAGVQTENLFDKDATDTENGYEQEKYIAYGGAVTSNSAWNVSEYIEVDSNTVYTCAYVSAGMAAAAVGCYDVNKRYINTSSTFNSDSIVTFTTGNDVKYVRISFRTDYKDTAMLVKGSTVPNHYIPHGYKLPLTITSGEQSQDIPIYIGDSKLGAEEYVDYESGKVYKRTAQLFDENAITRNQSINYRTGVAFPSQSSYLSDYIDINNAVALSILISNSSGTSTSQSNRGWCYFDAQQNFISGITWAGRTTTTTTFTVNSVPENAKYLRFSIDKNVDAITLVKGSTTPAQRIPYLQPTDPPVSLPEINNYQGENTLSSTETLGEATIKGRINELPSTP